MAVFSYDSAYAWVREQPCGERFDPGNPEDRDRYTLLYQSARDKAKEEFISLIRVSEGEKRVELLKYVLKNGRGELLVKAVEAVREYGLNELRDLLYEIFGQTSMGARRAILAFLADYPAQRSYAFLRTWMEKANEGNEWGSLKYDFGLLQKALCQRFPVVAWADRVLSDRKKLSPEGFTAKEMWVFLKEMPAPGDALRLGCHYLSTAPPETTENFLGILRDNLYSRLHEKGLPQDSFRAGLLLINRTKMEKKTLQKITSWLHRASEKDRRECLQVLPLKSTALLLQWSLRGAPQHVRQSLKVLKILPEVVPELYDSLMFVVRRNDDLSLAAVEALLSTPRSSMDTSEINAWLNYWLIFGAEKKQRRVARIIATTSTTVGPHLFALPESAGNLLLSTCKEYNPKKLAALLSTGLRESPALSKAHYRIAVDLYRWLDQRNLVTKQLEVDLGQAFLRTIVNEPTSASWISEGLLSLKNASHVFYQVLSQAIDQLQTCLKLREGAGRVLGMPAPVLFKRDIALWAEVGQFCSRLILEFVAKDPSEIPRVSGMIPKELLPTLRKTVYSLLSVPDETSLEKRRQGLLEAAEALVEIGHVMSSQRDEEAPMKSYGQEIIQRFEGFLDRIRLYEDGESKDTGTEDLELIEDIEELLRFWSIKHANKTTQKSKSEFHLNSQVRKLAQTIGLTMEKLCLHLGPGYPEKVGNVLDKVYEAVSSLGLAPVDDFLSEVLFDPEVHRGPKDVQAGMRVRVLVPGIRQIDGGIVRPAVCEQQGE